MKIKQYICLNNLYAVLPTLKYILKLKNRFQIKLQFKRQSCNSLNDVLKTTVSESCISYDSKDIFYGQTVLDIT